jgi:uncharacterized protein DUF1579
MIKRLLFVVSIAVLAIVSAQTVVAQTAPSIPKPTAGHKALEFFIGTWKTDAYMSQNPLSPAGKVTGTITCEPFTGGFHVVCHTDANYPIGPLKMLGVYHYNPTDKVYTYFAIDSQGMGGPGKGTMPDDDTWVYTGEGKMGNIVTRSRYVVHKTSADSYTFKWEIAAGDQPWVTILEGTDTRVKSSS